MEHQTTTPNAGTKTFGGYLDSISRATGVKARSTLMLIEDLMRTQHRTLDGLTRRQFDDLARACHEASTYLAVA